MELEDLKKVLNEELNTFKKSLPDFASKEDVQTLITKYETEAKENGILKEMQSAIDEIKDIAEKQGLAMQKIVERKDQKKSLDEIIGEHADSLKVLAKGNKNFTLELEVSKTNVLRTSVTDHTLAYRLPEVGQQAYRGLLMRSLFRSQPVGPNSGGVIRYVDQSTVTRNAAEKAEAAAYPESAIAWTEYSLPIEKVTDSIPVSYEMFNDVAFVSGELDRLMNINLPLRVDSQLYSGDGVTPNIKGIYTSAATYTAGAAGITGANIYDLIIKMQEDIASGKESKYMPNVALVNYTDWNEILTTKATDGHYLKPEWAEINSANGVNNIMVNGIQVLPSSLVTANTMLVGDFNWATIYTLDSIMVEMGWVNDQFTKDLFTIKAKERLALLHRTVDANAFKKCTDIDAALVTLAS